jgi:hypothetical protein
LNFYPGLTKNAGCLTICQTFDFQRVRDGPAATLATFRRDMPALSAGEENRRWVLQALAAFDIYQNDHSINKNATLAGID